jgi:integrase
VLENGRGDDIPVIRRASSNVDRLRSGCIGPGVLSVALAPAADAGVGVRCGRSRRTWGARSRRRSASYRTPRSAAKQLCWGLVGHGAASLLLAKGVHPRVVMEMLGHSTIALTMNVYSHVIPELQREAADQMEAVFGA